MAVTVAALLARYTKKLARVTDPARIDAILGELQGTLDDTAHASKHWSEAEFTAVMHVETEIDPFTVAGRVKPANTFAWMTKYTAKWQAKAARVKKR